MLIHILELGQMDIHLLNDLKKYLKARERQIDSERQFHRPSNSAAI